MPDWFGNNEINEKINKTSEWESLKINRPCQFQFQL